MIFHKLNLMDGNGSIDVVFGDEIQRQRFLRVWDAINQGALRWEYVEARMVHQCAGPNCGWTLDELLPGDSPTYAVDAARKA